MGRHTDQPAIAAVRSDLSAAVDAGTRDSARRFFKEPILVYGVKTAEVRRIARRRFAETGEPSKARVFDLCGELWRSGYMEECFIACHWSYEVRTQYERSDLDVFERWIDDYVSNWATCDTLCNHTVGSLLEMYPDCAARLEMWTGSRNRWKRRAAAVSVIIPARNGQFLPEILRIADALLEDDDDLVRKGYGWMLKAASESHVDEVFEYVVSHRAAMPRTALRYAIEKMPKELKAKAMAK